MEREYFERLINAQFDHLKSEIKDLKTDTEKILTQTTITNGRVTALEKRAASEDGAKQVHDNNRKSNSWLVVLLVSVLSTLGTIVATKLWH